MKDRKSLLLIVVSFLLFIVSFTLLWTWGYRFYIKSPSDKVIQGQVMPSTPASATATRDTLQKLYTATLNNLDTQFDSARNNADSLRGRLDMRLGEFYRLRNEIAVLLKNQLTDTDLDLARHKITELQQRVKDLLDRNLDVEYENKKLSAVLEQLTKVKNLPVNNIQSASYNNPQLVDKNEPSVAFTATELRLTALMTSAEKEEETLLAQETQKLVGSFFVKSNVAQNNTTELYIVVIQPDGQVLKNSDWESGAFVTNEGRKIYSCKMRFDNKSGEVKRMAFSLNADKYQKGNYTMQVYYKGLLIGKVQKSLS